MKKKPLSHSAFEKTREEGRTLRKKVPRKSHAAWNRSQQQINPLEILKATGKMRLAHLLPLRHGRMSRSPFAYCRGSAGLMAADLASTPVTGLSIQACGDCHLGNFGAFASPERRVLFDLTDFDETLAAPWEFDLKRLATSFMLLAREKGYNRATSEAVTRTMLESYRRRLHEFATLSPLERWYSLIDSEMLIRTAPDAATRRRREEFENKARRRTADRIINRLLEEKRGRLRFIEHRPVLARLDHDPALKKSFCTVLQQYPASLSADRRFFLSRYSLVDLAFKVVGVGSVGTRCAVALFVSQSGHKLVLQVKEALPSVLLAITKKSSFKHEGKRIVVGQRLMQCASDIFLGWGEDDHGRHYYVRQLRDMKTSVPLEVLDGPVLNNFAEMCGWALARAQAKAGDSVRISGYIGNSEAFDDAITRFAGLYADQCEQDYDVFKRAIRGGKIPVELEDAASA